MSDKDKIIRQIYYDVDDGFGSINETYRKAHHILNTITLNDVKEFLNKQKSRQTKAYRGFNSYVAKEPLQELQIDIADFTRSAEMNEGYRYAFVAVDIFTKICHAVPIKNKQPQESIRAIKQVFEKIGVPEVLYHDNEGSWSSTQFIRLINHNKIKQIITSTPPPFAESMIRTLKSMIHTRLEGFEMGKEKWVDMLPSVLKKYNNTKHSTTDFSPNEAKKKDNHFEVWLNITSKATYNRKYPPLKISDKVRTYVKQKSMKKGTDSHWSKEIYTITFIKDKQYLINDHRRRVWNRWELLKVNASEGKDG